MGLIEWLGESFNPGPVGHVAFEGPAVSRGTRGATLVRGLLALVLLATILVALRVAFPSREAGFVILRVMGIYLLVSFFIRARPDRRNVGGLGGFIDHPFRYSDDINRLLVLLAVVMAPGRFVTGSLRDAWRALTSGSASPRPPAPFWER